MKISSLDHIVLTVANIENTCKFYTDTLGMQMVQFGEGRTALHFGNQKINLHEKGNEFEPKAVYPTPGSADICFITDFPLDQVIEEITTRGETILEGPVEKTGANGPMRSIYLRDPDLNLIEISNYI